MIFLVTACGGVAENRVSLGDAGTTSPESGASRPPRNPDCPAAIPLDGAPCAAEVQCEYHTPEAPGYCTTFATCVGQSVGSGPLWVVTPPDEKCVVGAHGCLSTFQAGAGGPCDYSLALRCYYDEGECACQSTSCSASMTSTWWCSPWGSDCPSPLPLIGNICAPGTPSCGALCGGAAGGRRECTDGYWAFSQDAVPCPACPQL